MGVRLLGKTGRLQTGTTLGSAVGADEEDKSKEQQTTTGEAAFGGTGGSVKPVTQQTAPQTKGSGFTNIQKILKASGTDTGPSRLAQTAAGGIRQAASGAQQGLAGATKEFGEKTEKATSAIPTSGSIGGIITGALGGTVSDTDLGTYQKAVSGKYEGPTSLGMTPEQQRAAAKSSALSSLAGDVSGRSALLQKYVGSPQYGQSKQTLDTLLLGRGGSSALRGALRQGARVEQDIKRQEIVAQEQAKQAQERARGIAEEAKTGLEQAKTGVMSGLETTKAEKIAGIQGAIDRVTNALKTGTVAGENRVVTPAQVSRADLRLLGIREEDLTGLAASNILNLDPSSYLAKFQDIDTALKNMSVGQYADPNQRAALRALGLLSGQENLGLTGELGSYYSSSTGQSKMAEYKDYVNTKLNEYIESTPEYQKQQKVESDALGSIKYMDFYSADDGILDPATRKKISSADINNLANSVGDNPGEIANAVNEYISKMGTDIYGRPLVQYVTLAGKTYNPATLLIEKINNIKQARAAKTNTKNTLISRFTKPQFSFVD